jgi:hypothetical protein
MDTATTPLMQDYAYLTAAGTITVSLTGLTAYNGYPFTLVVYAAGDNASPSQGASLAVTAGATGGNTASTLTTSGNPDRKLSDGPGVAYNTFTGTLTNGTLTFTATRLAGSTYLGLNGFQLQMFLLPPVITSQPVSQTTFTSGTASFSVGAAGATPLSYQWQANGGTGFTNLINGGQISGVNTNVLTISGATTNWALTYQVIVTNSVGSITSSPATLTLVSYPLFVTNSISIQNYSFENPVVTDGNFTTTLPGWNTSGNAGAFAIINPGTGNWPSATPSGMDGVNAGQIFMTAGGQSGIFYQDTGIKYVAGVTYQLTAAIGLQSNQVFDTNSAMVFYNSALTAIASNVITPAKLSTGAFTNLTLTYTATGNEGGNGDVVVGFYAPPAAVGSSYFDFDNVRLSAIYPNGLFISSQPVSQSTYQGQTISFSVTAVGSGTLGYQWQATNSASGGFTNLVNGGVISGVTSNVLTIASVTTNWSLAYQVVVTNASGSVTGAPATLTVVWTNIYVVPGGNVQVAINQAYANGGGQVNLAPGTYYGNIVMYPSVTLNGSGSNTIIAASTISGPQNNPASGYTVQNLVVDGQISCSYFSIGATNVPGLASVSGLTGLPGINGGNPSGSPASYNLTYRNVEVKNTSIGMQCWSVYGLVITNCNFHDDGIGFSHNIYLVGCPGFKFINCISAWSRTGDGLHLDFVSNGGFTNSFIQSEFDGEWNLGILNQAFNGSANYIQLTGCGIKFCGQAGSGNGDGIDTDYIGNIQTSRMEYNLGIGAWINGGITLLNDSFNGNGYPYIVTNNSLAINNLVGGTGANVYHATLANGVNGPNNTADWVTIYGGQTEGAVDFNANHSLNGSLTWPNVSAPSAGTYPLILSYANGTSSNLTLQIIVNGGATNSLTFPPTGGWSTYNNVTTNFALTGANNTVQLNVAYPGATSPILSSLKVTASTPAVPSAPTGLTYLALTNAPKYDMSCWIQLSWNAVTGATYYNIQRNGVWLAIGVPTNGFTDYHVPFTGSAFTYTVVPVNAGGSGTGTSITAYSLTGFPVVLTAATNGPGSVTLTCAWSTNAPTYNVYRAPVSGGPYTFIGSTGLTTNISGTTTNYFGIYTDTNAPGGTNYYVMTAYNGITESLYSPEASAIVTGVAPVLSTNAYLTSLTLNPVLSFTPAFSSSTFSYTATVAYGSSPTVTAVNANGNATNQLIYNGATNVLAAGNASAPLTLNPNPAVTNVLQVQVTAQDGVTRQSYTVNVVQQPSQSKPVLTSSVSNGTLTLTWPVDHLGYRLLTQTNNLNLGVSANLNDWATVPGATATNLINLPISTTNFDAYYRLVYP